jgi:glycine C-acetyltransferase
MRHGDRDCVMWSINDYLGLAGHPALKQVAAESARRWGVSAPMGSRMMSGTTSPHLALEASLAAIASKQDACLFNFGYLGVMGTIQALLGPEDTLVMDKLAHASIVDAARISISSRRQLRVFRHNDTEHLEALLRSINKQRRGGVMILVEGVYGMTGDCAPLADIIALKEAYGARLFVDDAHGFGVVGPGGRGTAALAGAQSATDIYFSTFAKAFASIGGFSAADRSTVEWIKYNARSQIFAKSLPMIMVDTLAHALEILEQEGADRRDRMWQRSRQLSVGLRDLGFYVHRIPSPLVPVLLPSSDDRDAMAWTAFLRERGVFVSPVVYPVVPRGVMLFRLVPTASHSERDVAETLGAFQELRDADLMTLGIPPEKVRSIYGHAFG